MTTKHSLLKAKPKYAFIDYILVIVALLFTGQATEYTGTIDFRINPVGGLSFLACVFYMIINEHKKIHAKEIGLGAGVLCILLAVQFLAGHRIDIVALYRTTLFTAFAWLLVKRLSYDILPLFEKIIAYWSLICLVMFVLQEVVGKSALASFAFAEPTYNSMGSFVFFSLSSTDLYGYNAFDRNYGFAWEPGLYASVLCTAIVINIYLHEGKMTFKNNKNLIILLLSILSSGSTTGYMTLAAIIIFEILKSKKFIYKVVALIIVIPLFVYVYNNTEFLSGKIKDNSQEQNFTTNTNTLEYAEKEEIQYTPQRFEGILLQTQNVINDPIAGYGFGQSWVRTNVSQYIAISTGILAVFAQFGILFGILYCMAYWRSYRMLGKHFDAPPLLFLVCYLMISVSYSFVFMPLYLCINLFSVFNRAKQ